MTQSSEDAILIACSTLEPSAEQRERLGKACQNAAVDWHLVYAAAVQHKVAPLVYQNLKRFEPLIGSIPQNVVGDFNRISRQNSVRNLLAADGLGRLAAYFRDHAHDLLLLKHTAHYFRHKALYDLTMSVDMDLVIRPSAEAADIAGPPYLWSEYGVTDATWKIVDEVVAWNDPRLRLLNLEIDNRLHHDVVWNGVIPMDFRGIWNDSDVYLINGQSVHVPRISDLIVMTAINIFRKPFLRLRNIVEIHELIRLQSPFDWETLSEKARSSRCASLVYSALVATRAILASDFGDNDLKLLKPAAFRTRAIALINRQIAPCDTCRPTSWIERVLGWRRGMTDLARRLLAMDLAQIARFFWFRIFLRRIARVIKH